MENLEKQHINEKCVYEKKTIDSKEIKDFIRPEWHREFREQHINSIKNSLLKGIHFSETITVNFINKQYRIINGNHRIESIKRILDENKNFSIDVRLARYDDLNLEKEIEIYEIINKTKTENSLDKLKAHIYDSFFLKEVQKSFPVKILFRNRGRTDNNALPITQIIFPYINRNTKMFVGGSNNEKSFETINNLGYGDVKRMRDFLNFFKEVFGDIHKENGFSDQNVIAAIAKIYYNNVGVDITEEQLKTRLEKIKNRYTQQLYMYRGSGWDKCSELYRFLLQHLSTRKPLFNVLEAKTGDKNE